jgi:hypothetical protein
MKQFKEILIVNSCEHELYSYKRIVDMFGLAEHIQTETNAPSALQYLKNNQEPPRYIVASLEEGEQPMVDFVEAYEKLHWTRRRTTELVLLYRDFRNEFDSIKRYRLLKKPLNVHELTDNRPPEDRLIN